MKDCVQKFVFESDDKIVISSNVIRSCLNMTLPLLYRLCIDVFFKPIRVLAEIKQRGIPMNFGLSIKQVFFLYESIIFNFILDLLVCQYHIAKSLCNVMQINLLKKNVMIPKFLKAR